MMKNVSVKYQIDRFIAILFIVIGSISCVFFTVCTFALIAALFSGESDIFAVALMVLLVGFGKILYDKGITRRNIIIKYEIYSKIVSGKSVMSLLDLSRILDTTLEQVQKDLNDILHSGYADDAYIGENNYRVIRISGTKIVFFSESVENDLKVAVTCPACGGISRIERGTDAKCDYCGSKVHE